MKEERYRETEPLKKGELVVMHTCVEARNPKYEGKIWTCKTDQFTRGEGVYAQDSVFLEGFTGSFAPEFLQRVNVEPLLTEKDATIENLREQVMLESKLYVALKGDFYTIKRENTRLRKALEDTREEIVNGTFDAAYFLIRAALGEGEKE